MIEPTKHQSNPFSTGGGGGNFETRVQAAFTVIMLSGRVAPCLPNFQITKIKLQGRYAGFNTDDFIVYSQHPHSGQQAKLLAQIKHDISITESDEIFAEVIYGAWNDFSGDNFNAGVDAIALITGPMSSADINNVRPILEWARHSENDDEFVAKVNALDFSSNAKRKKLEAFKTQLKKANNDADISNFQLWEFFKSFHIIGYDLDVQTGSTYSLLLSLISLYSNEAPTFLWSRVVDVVQAANQNAGTITFDTIPEDVRSAFSTTDSSSWLSDITKLKEHGQYIIRGIRTTVGEVHIKQSASIAQLFDLAESSYFILVSGERGCGKSGLIRTFTECVSNNAPIFCLRTEDFDKPHLDTVFSGIGLKNSLSTLEAGFALFPKKYLIIESLEKLLELEHTVAFSDLLHFLNPQHGWTVIASCRDYAYQQVTFNFLQPSGIKFSSITLDGFDDEQIQTVCTQSNSLQNFATNQNLKPLLKSPFFANLAYRVLATGTEFGADEGEKEFRVAVWRDVISKEQDRKNGMPIKRKQTFINIAVKRAKQMVYGVQENGFDTDAILKLEEDDIVRRDTKYSLISPAHDVLEDWALEYYIENAYQQWLGNSQKFLDEIGDEPAINRAFRLWLHQKLKYGENVTDFVCSILVSQGIKRYWQDETIAAVLQGDNPEEFLDLLKNRLLLEDGTLLKRFCFILRIACQTPDQKVSSILKKDSRGLFVDLLFLKPYGKGWQALIRFLFNSRESLSNTLALHVTALLNDWVSVLHLEQPLPVLAHKVGLLAIHFLSAIKESYRNRDDGERKKLLSIILKTSSEIQDEFVALLEADVFARRGGRHQRRLHYVDEFCEMAFSGIEAAFFCKYNPDLLIKLARFEWFVQEPDEDNKSWSRSRTDVAECFGLHEYKYQYYPASGAKGPFSSLLMYHPMKGLDFIIELLNVTAHNYAHSNLDHSNGYYYLSVKQPSTLIEHIKIQLNDGVTINQYCTSRLWLAYRGKSVIPYLLQCALMALENWLVAYTENCGPSIIELLFDYILRNSNSVMPTAVLASVAIGFPNKVGKAALPLLRSPELYALDLGRSVQEMGENESNWFSYNRDAFYELYTQDRRTAALRPWRKEHLENLITRLQFSEWREEALAAIDMLNASAPKNETMRFLLHRIDSRGWKPVEDKENNRIIFESSTLETDLKEIQQKSQDDMRIINRFSALYIWAKKTFSRETIENQYNATLGEALSEATELISELNKDIENDFPPMYCGSLVTAATVFVRDYYSELTEEYSWCSSLILEIVKAKADSDDPSAAADATDHDGAAAAATVLPILLDFASNDEDKLMIIEAIVTALTHVNENVRLGAADGIREYLWEREPVFAHYCLIGAIEYARFEQSTLYDRRLTDFEEENYWEISRVKQKVKKDEFRQKFLRGECLIESSQITLQTHSSSHIIAPFSMIPYGSTEPEYVNLFSQMLGIVFELEKNKHKYHSDRDSELNIDYGFSLKFAKRFANYLFHLHHSNFFPYLELMREGCDIAPSFMSHFILFVAMDAEKKDMKEVFWSLWKELSQKVQEIAIAISDHDSNYDRDNGMELVRRMLMADIPWKRRDFENQEIAYGKDLILEFVTKAGQNQEVFEALARLIYYFQSIFFESGISILAKLQKENGGSSLFTGVNTAFYLESAIQRFLQVQNTGPVSRNLHQSCLILLDAIVETASSRAYYLREHLVRSRKIL